MKIYLIGSYLFWIVGSTIANLSILSLAILLDFKFVIVDVFINEKAKRNDAKKMYYYLYHG